MWCGGSIKCVVDETGTTIKKKNICPQEGFIFTIFSKPSYKNSFSNSNVKKSQLLVWKISEGNTQNHKNMTSKPNQPIRIKIFPKKLMFILSKVKRSQNCIWILVDASNNTSTNQNNFFSQKNELVRMKLCNGTYSLDLPNCTLL
jgi:hypothetical protein